MTRFLLTYNQKLCLIVASAIEKFVQHLVTIDLLSIINIYPTHAWRHSKVSTLSPLWYGIGIFYLFCPSSCITVITRIFIYTSLSSVTSASFRWRVVFLVMTLDVARWRFKYLTILLLLCIYRIVIDVLLFWYEKSCLYVWCANLFAISYITTP